MERVGAVRKAFCAFCKDLVGAFCASTGPAASTRRASSSSPDAGRLESVAPFIKPTEPHRAEMHVPQAIIDRLEADVFPRQHGIRPYRVQDELARGRIVVIAGYQGVSYRREVTTLGRGGSDTTAVAMAAALGAEWCEICSDVDGVYTADPRVVPAATRIGALTYEETQELAESGAKVLNAQAVEFAKERGIAIYARATASGLPGDDPSSDGTVVRRYAPRVPGTVAGVASERDVLVLQAVGEPMRLLTLLDECSVSGKQLHVAPAAGGPDAVTLVISRENLHNEEKLRRDLAGLGGGARIVDGLGALSVIGAGINATYGNVCRGSACLESHGIATHGLSTSSFRTTWLVPRDRLDEAVRGLHAEFIEREALRPA